MSKKVICELCPTECELEDYQVGACKARVNRGGELFSLVYGRPCAAHLDPIEKKPFFHFYPASKAFSIATAGCTLSCKFCQNWEISQAAPDEVDALEMPPEAVVSQARKSGAVTITYTYTEPAVFYEYMFDTAVLARKAGLKNSMHTCGYINPAPLKELCQYMDAADVDLKAFTEDFYGRICGGRLRPVLDSIVTLRERGVWLELTNLVIPTLNDNMDDIRRMSRWMVENLGPDVPIHFSRFYPHYKLKNLPPTPPETLLRARAVAQDAGVRYVYIGNLRSPAESTYCHSCGKTIIERTGYHVSSIRLNKGRCYSCGTAIPGVWWDM